MTGYRRHIALLTSDGQVLISGKTGQKSDHGNLESRTTVVPELPSGVGYVRVSAGGDMTGFIRSDGQVVFCGDKWIKVPSPPNGVKVVDLAVGRWHMDILRDDGQVDVAGGFFNGRVPRPKAPDGIIYTSVSAGNFHTVLIRSDGKAVAVWANDSSRLYDVPDPPADVSYINAACGLYHSVIIRSDGRAAEFGRYLEGVATIDDYARWDQDDFRWAFPQLHSFDECRVLEPPPGVNYISAAAGSQHTILLRSDGKVDAFGDNTNSQCSVPDLPEGVTYVSVAAGDLHTVLIRSDGQAAAFGSYIVGLTGWDHTTPAGQYTRSLGGPQPHVEIGGSVRVPDLPEGVGFVARGGGCVAVSIETKDTGKQVEVLIRTTLTGDEVATLRFSKNRWKAEVVQTFRETIASKVGVGSHQLKVLLPDSTILDLREDKAKVKKLIPEDTSSLVGDPGESASPA